MTREEYKARYCSDEDLRLPYSPRTYFDSLCHEFSCYPVENKLLDIGYLTWHGLDIKPIIKKIPEDYPHVSEDDVHYGVIYNMAAACGVNPVESGLMERGNTLDTDIDLMIEEIMRRYRFVAAPNGRHYMADSPRGMALHELRDMNGWVEAAGEIQPYLMYSEGNMVAYPGDAWLLRRHNLRIHEGESRSDTAFMSYVCPEPWYGNPLKARVIILGDMPRYDDFVCRVQNLVNSAYPQLVEAVQCSVRNWMALYGNWHSQFYTIDGMFTAHFSQQDGDEFSSMVFNTMDGYNSPLYRRWVMEFANLAERLSLPSQNVYDKFAVINSNPYYSTGGDPLAAGLLPSHYFLRQLVRYITNSDPTVLFVIPSAGLDKVWRRILDDVYTDLIAFGRVVVGEKNPRIPRLDPGVLGQEGFRRITEMVEA